MNLLGAALYDPTGGAAVAKVTTLLERIPSTIAVAQTDDELIALELTLREQAATDPSVKAELYALRKTMLARGLTIT